MARVSFPIIELQQEQALPPGALSFVPFDGTDICTLPPLAPGLTVFDMQAFGQFDALELAVATTVAERPYNTPEGMTRISRIISQNPLGAVVRSVLMDTAGAKAVHDVSATFYASAEQRLRKYPSALRHATLDGYQGWTMRLGGNMSRGLQGALVGRFACELTYLPSMRFLRSKGTKLDDRVVRLLSGIEISQDVPNSSHRHYSRFDPHAPQRRGQRARQRHNYWQV